MAWRVRPVDAKTHNGQKAVFVREDNSNWPAPWIFEIDGQKASYSIGGFYLNHMEPFHTLDLVGPWLDELDLQITRAAIQFARDHGPVAKAVMTGDPEVGMEVANRLIEALAAQGLKITYDEYGGMKDDIAEI